MVVKNRLYIIVLVLFFFQNIVFSNGEKIAEDIAEYKDAKYYYDLGLKHLKNGNLSRAEFYLRRAQKLDPYNSKIYTALGNVYLKNKKIKEAKKTWEDALRINPQDSEARKNLHFLSTYSTPSQEEEVIFYNLPQRAKEEREVVVSQSRVKTEEEIKPKIQEIPPHIRQEQLSFAQRELETALAFAPNNSDIHFNLALIFSERNNLDKAIFHFEKASMLEQDNWEKSLYLGIAYLKAGYEEKAESKFREVLKANPQNYLALSYRGLILQKKGMADEALDHFKKAQTLFGGFFLPYFGIAAIYTKEGKFLEAKHQWEETKRIFPTSEVHNNLGYTCVKIKSWDCAKSEFLSAIEKDRSNSLAYYNLGMMYVETGNLQEAINTWEKFLIINPKDAEIRYRLAFLYENTGEIDKAIEEYRKVLSLDPTNVPAQSNFANAVARKALPYRVTQRKQPVEIDYKYSISYETIPIDFPK